MRLSEIEQIVAGGESTTVEFKATTGQRIAAAKTVCAMLNGRGGFVLFGVSPRSAVVGQLIGEGTLEELSNELRKIDPPSSIDIETVPLPNGNQVITLCVPGGSSPYAYDGRPYQRQEPVTTIMPRSQYERLLTERIHATTRWENQVAGQMRVSDLDSNEIVKTVEEAIRRGRMDDPGTRDIKELLIGLNLLNDDGLLLNGAVVLFGRSSRIVPNYPQCLLKMARFRGLSHTDDFLDNRQEYGNIFELLTRGQRFMRDYLPVAGRIVPSLFERVDDPLYPPIALREALANALCHRDYSAGAGSVSIAIFDDRLEISSTGSLPFGLTPADLVKSHPSKPWNPLIAQALHRRGIIETWGRGTLKMVALMEEAGLYPPEFVDDGHQVIVRFLPIQYVPPTRVGHDLSQLQRDLLDLLSQIGPCPLSALVNALPESHSLSTRAIQDNLAFLRSLQLIDNYGWGAGARWALKGVPPQH